MKNLLYILMVLVCSFTVQAQQTPISEANDFYQKGEYEKAIKSYEFVLETHIESPEIYFNLANAYYKTGQIAPSILNYERAKLLAPEDGDIQYNLKLAQVHVLDKLEVLPELLVSKWYAGIRNAFSAKLWSYFSIALFFICLVFACFYLYSNKVGLKKLGFLLATLCLILSILSYSFASQKTKEIAVREYAIIFNPSVTIKGSPDDSGTELFLLHEGTKVKVIDSLGDWRNIQLSDGNEGWLKKEDIEKI
ncbi:tetratricopeptide repeat protein [Marinifilum sp. RC60d5]|uniref:tetratricopeptide repeat protein n=1 Tax=Marinifilum sp. RC60d5 TaxID=3458414 RepID=UPI004036C651